MEHAVDLSTAIKDLAGNPLARAYTWTFRTGAASTRAWSTPLRIDSSSAGAGGAVVAATAEDVPSVTTIQATAVWTQSDGPNGQGNIYANRYQNGAWQGARLVEMETAVARRSSGGASQARVAMGALGRTVILWSYDNGNAEFSIWGAADGENGPLLPGNARQISFGGNAGGPQLSFDGGGHDVFSVWTQYDPARLPASYHATQRRHLFPACELILPSPCAINPDDFGWRETTLLETSPYGAVDVNVSGFGSGGAVAVWSQVEGLLGLELWASTYSNVYGGWATPVRVNPGSGNRAERPVVAAASDGSAIVAWIESVAGRQTIFASRLGSAGWSGPVAFDDATRRNPSDPRLVVDAAGNTLIVWAQEGVILARRCPPGPLTGCSAPARINALPAGAAPPRLAGRPNGDAIVVWSQDAVDAGGPQALYAQHYLAGSGWVAAPSLIDTGNASGAEIAMDKHGHATMVWSKADPAAGGKFSIYASRY